MLISAGLGLPTVLASVARAELYRWTDENGTEHFTSDPSQVPARYRNAAPAPDDGTGPRVNFISGDSQSSPARQDRLDELRARRRNAPPPRRSSPQTADPPVQRSSRAKRSKPHKYDRDCSNAYRAGRCRSWVNPDWKRWKQEQDADDDDN